MASPAYRSKGTTVGGSTTSYTPGEPAGAALDDIFLAWLYLETGVGNTVTPPAGWSNVFNGVTAQVAVTGANGLHTSRAYWIRRGSSAPALTWSFSTSFGELTIEAISGAYNSGDPWSFFATAARDDQTSTVIPAISGTTDTADELLLWGAADYVGGTSSVPPTGFTERQEFDATHETALADKAQAVAGATGSITGASWVGTNGNVTEFLAGLRSLAAPSGGNLNALIGEPITGSSQIEGGLR